MRRPFILCALTLIGLLAAAPSHAQSGGGSGQSALNEDLRISAIEDQMRNLTGRIEELNNNLHQLKDQLDRLSSDVDLRFSQLQGQGAPGAAPSPATTGAPRASSPAPNPPAEPRPSQGAGDMSRPPTKSGTLGTLGGPAPAASNQQLASTAANLPEGSAQEQYNYAMGLLTQANYPAAEQAMRSFVQRWPNDPLAGNAQYWLGETFYVRKDYASAATAFAQGYEKYPKGSKAADDLLKLGMSLANLNQKADACRAYARLQHDFPLPPQAVRDRLASEKQRAGCSS